jgi:hypothetical protein
MDASTYSEALRVKPERPQPEPYIVPLKTAAALLGGVGVAKMKRLGRSGELVCVMVGPHFYFTTASVRAFSQRGEAPRAARKDAPRQPRMERKHD